MGCTTSKAVKKGKKGKKERKKRGLVQDEDEENFDAIVIVDETAKPEQLKKEINKLYKIVNEKRETLKKSLRPFLAEKRGLTTMLEEEKEKLLTLLDTKNQLDEEKKKYLETLFDKDADEIFRCYEAKDKTGLCNVVCNRTRDQLEKVCQRYEQKFGESLRHRLESEGKSLTGSLFTGSLTNFSKLVLYRIMPPDERDAGFLREFTTKGMSIQDENILEVILTRTNRELSAALDFHADETGKPLRDILSAHSYKNYREFIAKVLECRRDERNEPFDQGTALRYAEELYEAGAGRYVGINAEPFIRILAVANKAQIDSINEKYKGKQLVKDITAKLGGDFGMAVKIRCTDKFVYLASRINGALKSTFSKDKELLCRVLGSLSRPECQKLREAYDKSDFGRSLEASLKASLSSESNFQKACLNLVTGDLSMCPLGSDKEPHEDEADLNLAGKRARETAEDHYNRQKVFDRGELLKKEMKISDDDEIPSFDLDKRNSSDIKELTDALEELESLRETLDRLKETIKEEIIATKETYFAIHSHCYETETVIGLLRSHVSNLKLYDVRRDQDPATLKKQGSIRDAK